MARSKFQTELEDILASPLHTFEEALRQALKLIQERAGAAGVSVAVQSRELGSKVLVSTHYLYEMHLPFEAPEDFMPPAGRITFDVPVEPEDVYLDVYDAGVRLVATGTRLEKEPEIYLQLYALMPSGGGEAAILTGALRPLALALRGSSLLARRREITNRLDLQNVREHLRHKALEPYLDLFESQTDGVVVVDSAGLVVFMNRSAEDITGYSRLAMEDRPLKSIVAEYQWNAVEDPATMPREMEIDFISSSGEPVYTYAYLIRPIRDTDLYVIHFRDITEARLLEEELRITSEFLSKLIDGSVNAIVAAEMTGRIILFNPAAESLFGYSAQDVVGKRSIASLFPPGRWEELLDGITGEEDGGPGRLELRQMDVVDAGGELVPANLTANVVENYRDFTDAVVVFLSSLKERRAIEHKLQEVQEKLQDYELLSELAGTLAHELNQPLTVIIGYAQALRSGHMKPEKMNRALSRITDEAERMAAIIRKIGRLTKFESRHYVGRANIFELNED